MTTGSLVRVSTLTMLVSFGCSSPGAGTGTSSSGDAGSSGSGGGFSSGGSLGLASSGVALAERSNSLTKQNHDLRCRVCPCGGFSPGSDVCLGAVFDQFPEAKKQVLCEIAAAERDGACLQGADDCAAADQCELVYQSEKGRCPVAQLDPAAFVPPPGCATK
jgi:hypothetical protein